MEQELVVITPERLKSLIREALDDYKLNEAPVNWMNATKAAQYMGVSRAFLHLDRRKGLLECYNPIPGGIVRCSRNQCDALIKRRMAEKG